MLAELARLGVAHVDAIAHPQAPGRDPEQRRLHLARPLLLVELEAPRQVGLRQAFRCGDAGGDVAAAQRGDHSRGGAADDRQHEVGGGRQGQGAIVVEQHRVVEAGAGGELGDDARRGGSGQAPGSAAVHELERRQLANRVDHPRQAAVDVALRGGLHAADQGAAQGAARDPVADAGDVSLVGHHPDQASAGTALDLGRRLARALRGPHRRALGADPRQLSAERPPADVQVQADAELGRAAPDRRLDQVEVGRAVDHRHRRARRLGGGQLDQLGERLAVGGRVGDDDVLEALPGEEQRLGQGEGEDALEAGVELEDATQDRHRAHRLGGDPDRLAGRLGEHEARVGVQRVEVDEGEGRRDRVEDRLVARVERLAVGRRALRLGGWCRSRSPPRERIELPAARLAKASS